jgi:multiple sugar transport system substrate-binding protein
LDGIDKRGKPMKRNARPPQVVALAAAGLVALTACGGDAEDAHAKKGSGKGQVEVWAHQGAEPEVDVLKEAVAGFNSSQNIVAVELKLIPEADYTQTVRATNLTELPDIIEFDGPLLSSFVYDGRLSPLEDFLSTETVSNQIESVTAQNTNQADGKLYGVSMFDSGLGIYGNKKLLDEAGVQYPTTWQDAWTADEFEAALDALAREDDDGKVLDIKENYAGEWPAYGFLPIVSSAGASVVVDNSASGHLDSEPVLEAVGQFASWKDYVDPNTDDSAFVSEKVALSWVGHWTYPTYADELGKDLVVMPLPDFGNGTKSGQGSWAWGVTSNSENGAAAGKFLDYLTADPTVTEMTAANGAPPGTASVTSSSELYRDGGPLQLFSDQLEATCGTEPPTPECVTVPRPLTPAYPVISAEFSKAFFAAYRGGAPAEVLGKAAASIDATYEDNNDYQ